MLKSETINELTAALVKARAAMPRITKERTAHVEGRTSAWSYTYADLADVLDAAVPALCKEGLLLVQTPQVTERHVCVETVLLHVSTQWIGCELSLPLAGDGAQAIGSALTYARRYSALCLLGLMPAGEDDDGAAAAARARQEKEKEPRRATAKAREGAPSDDEIQTAKEALEEAAQKGMQTLGGILAAQRQGVLAALGVGYINGLRQKARQVDAAEVSPA